MLSSIAACTDMSVPHNVVSVSVKKARELCADVSSIDLSSKTPQTAGILPLPYVYDLVIHSYSSIYSGTKPVVSARNLAAGV